MRNSCRKKFLSIFTAAVMLAGQLGSVNAIAMPRDAAAPAGFLKSVLQVKIGDTFPEGPLSFVLRQNDSPVKSATGSKGQTLVFPDLENGDYTLHFNDSGTDKSWDFTVDDADKASADLGKASSYNAFVKENLSACDVEGTIAAGGTVKGSYGDLKFSEYPKNSDRISYIQNLKDGINPSKNSPTSIICLGKDSDAQPIDGTSNWMIAGNTYWINPNEPVKIRKEGPSDTPLVNFDDEFTKLENLSQELASLAPTGTVSGDNTLNVDAGSELNVFNIDSGSIANNPFRFSSKPSGTVIINVSGTKLSLRDLETSRLGDYGGNEKSSLPCNIIWNFAAADEITFTNCGISGAILAPNAKITAAQGQFNGTLAAKSLSGNTEGHARLTAYKLPDESKIHTIDLNNTPPAAKTGSLSLSKRIAGAAEAQPLPADFSFNVTLLAKTGDMGTAFYTDPVLIGDTSVTPQDGVITVNFYAGEPGGSVKTICNIKEGTFYTVKENNAIGYALTGIVHNDTALENPKDPVAGRICADTADKIEFTNTAAPPAPQFSSLTLQKKLADETGSAQDSFLFTVQISTTDTGLTPYNGPITVDGQPLDVTNGQVSLKANQSAVINNLPVGTVYQITEESSQAYTLESVSINEHPVEYSSNTILSETNEDGSRVVFTNKAVPVVPPEKFGSVSITKAMEDNRSAGDKVFEFSVSMLDKNSRVFNQVKVNGGAPTVLPNGNVLVKLKANETAVISGIPEGAVYSIAETNRQGYLLKKITKAGGNQEMPSIENIRVTVDAVDSYTFTNGEKPQDDPSSSESSKPVTPIDDDSVPLSPPSSAPGTVDESSTPASTVRTIDDDSTPLSGPGINTGDDTNILLLLGLALISVTSAVILIASKQKNSKRAKRLCNLPKR